MSIVSEPEETVPPPVRPATPPPPSPPAQRGAWKGLALRLHFYAGLFAAPFILIATLTGVLYAIAPQLETLVYRDQLTTTSTGPALPLAAQVQAALAVNPGDTLDAVRPAPEPGATTRVLFNREGLGDSQRWTVFVDPATAEVKGELATYGSSGALPLRSTFSQLHRNLLLGEPGRIYSELAASWLWFVALGGLVLWVARWRANHKRRLADLVVPRTGVKGRRKQLGRHGTLGVWLLLGTLFLSATGMTWSTYAGANISTLRTELGWTTPQLSTGGGHAGHGGSEATEPPPAVSPATFDSVLATARGAGLDAGAVELATPNTAGATWTVTEIKSSLPNEADKAAIDAATDTVVDVVRFADYPLMAKLTTWGIAGHMGTLFGLANQLLLLAFALGLAAVILLGYRMWWMRRPTRGGTPTPLAPRGQFRKLSQPVGFAVVLGAVVIGWFAPLFGISLVAFLLFDAWRGHRAAKASSTTGA
ncbi:PepSY-associated TM helix domain-containing protein [Pseudonocardia pini]|uniref:PepSY-associated TM helix domain-containing protein n=1 Tax=Pseudonocardia pini TaxID=2758030 RepID=UPI0015F107FC|nr:PepSY domain-containing protein [Pseudonocardia pini]